MHDSIPAHTLPSDFQAALIHLVESGIYQEQNGTFRFKHTAIQELEALIHAKLEDEDFELFIDTILWCAHELEVSHGAESAAAQLLAPLDAEEVLTALSRAKPNAVREDATVRSFRVSSLFPTRL